MPEPKPLREPRREHRLAARAELEATLEPVFEQIRARGGRITWPRVAILEALVEGDHHVTVERLEQRLKVTAPEVHETTLYRTLSALEELGVIYHLHLGHGPSVWHLATAHHEHLVCSACGRIVEVDAAQFDGLRRSIARQFGFTLDTHHFVNQGRCAACTTTPTPR